MDGLAAWVAAHPEACAWFTAAVRFVFPLLALPVLARAIRSLCRRCGPTSPCPTGPRSP